MEKTIHFEGPCPFLLCLEAGPHEHPICPACGAVNYGNVSCSVCRSEGRRYRRRLLQEFQSRQLVKEVGHGEA